MTKFNNYVPQAPKTYEVRYVELKEPSKISKFAGYLGVKTVENCKNTLCGCSCSSSTCNCPTTEASLCKEGIFSLENHSVSGKANIDKLKLSGQYSRSALRINDESGDAKFLSGTAGGKFDLDGIGVKLNADLINVKSDGVQVRAGFTFDTGVTVSEGVKEVKLAGFVASVDENQIGISTPFGEIKFNYR